MERLEERKKRDERVSVKWVVQLPYGFALTSSTCSLVIRLFPSKPRLSRVKPGAASVLVTIPLTSLAKHLAHLRRQRPPRRLATFTSFRSTLFHRSIPSPFNIRASTPAAPAALASSFYDRSSLPTALISRSLASLKSTRGLLLCAKRTL